MNKQQVLVILLPVFFLGQASNIKVHLLDPLRVVTDRIPVADIIRSYMAPYYLLKKLTALNMNIRCAAYSCDKKYIAIAGDYGIKIHDAQTYKSVKNFDLPMSITAIAYCPWGNYLVYAGSGFDGKKLVMFDAESGTSVLEVTAPNAEIESITFALGGSEIITRATDGAVHIWDAHTFEMIKTYPQEKNFIYAQVSPDSKVMATFYNNQLMIWNTQACRLITTLPTGSAQVKSLSFSANNTDLLFVSRNTVYIYRQSAQASDQLLDALLHNFIFAHDVNGLFHNVLTPQHAPLIVLPAAHTTALVPANNDPKRASFHAPQFDMQEDIWRRSRNYIKAARLLKLLAEKERHAIYITKEDNLLPILQTLSRFGTIEFQTEYNALFENYVVLISENSEALNNLESWTTILDDIKELNNYFKASKYPETYIQSVRACKHKLTTLLQFLKTESQYEKSKFYQIIKAIDSCVSQLLNKLLFFIGHTNEVICKEINGSYMITGSKDNTARVWDLASWKPELMDLHSQIVNVMRSYILSHREQNIIMDYIGESGQSKILTGHTEPINVVALSQSGKYAATGAGKRAVCWQLDGKKKLTQQLPFSITSIGFVGDNCVIGMVNQETITLNVVTGAITKYSVMPMEESSNVVANLGLGNLMANGFDEMMPELRPDDQQYVREYINPYDTKCN